MYKTHTPTAIKLFKTIGMLSDEEFKRFGEFVKSPYFNKSKKIRLLYWYIKTGKFEAGRTTLIDISDQLYDDGKYNDNRIRLVITDFIKLIEKFTVIESFRHEHAITAHRVSRFYRERADYKTALKIIDVAEKELAKDQSRDELYHYMMSNLHIEKYLSSIGEHLSKSNAQKIESSIIKDSIYEFVEISLKSYIHMVSNDPSLGLSGLLKIPFAKAVLQFVKANLREFSVSQMLIYAHYMALMSYVQPDSEEYFFNLKIFVDKNRTKIDPRYIMSFCLHLHNYCTERLNDGVIKFRREAFEIDRMLDRNNDLFGSRYLHFMDHVHFLNISYTAIVAGELKWAENFIKKHKENISPRFRESTYSLILAELQFENRNYENTLEYLNNISISNNLFFLYAQILRLKTFYETGEYEMLLSILDSIAHYLIRNKQISPRNVKLYKSAIKIFRLLARKKFVDKDLSLAGAVKKLETDHSLPHGDWLLEKAKELVEKHF